MKGWGSGNIGAAKITRPHSAVSGGLVFLLRPNTTTLLRPKVTNNCALVAWRNWHFANSTSPARSHLSTGCAMVQTMMPRQRDYGWRSQVEAEDNCRERRHIPSSNLDCTVSTYQRPSNGRRGVLIRFATRHSLETTCANNYRSARMTAYDNCHIACNPLGAGRPAS